MIITGVCWLIKERRMRGRGERGAKREGPGYRRRGGVEEGEGGHGARGGEGCKGV